MAKEIDLNDGNFGETIASGVTLVDFWAPWCGPCMMQGPILEKVAEAVGDRAKVAKLNVDEGQRSAAQYGVRSIPTLIIFKDGEPVQQFVGVQSESQLVSAIDSVAAAG
jgi:thioredoxin 1